MITSAVNFPTAQQPGSPTKIGSPTNVVVGATPTVRTVRYVVPGAPHGAFVASPGPSHVAAAPLGASHVAAAPKAAPMPVRYISSATATRPAAMVSLPAGGLGSMRAVAAPAVKSMMPVPGYAVAAPTAAVPVTTPTKAEESARACIKTLPEEGMSKIHASFPASKKPAPRELEDREFHVKPSVGTWLTPLPRTPTKAEAEDKKDALPRSPSAKKADMSIAQEVPACCYSGVLKIFKRSPA